MILYEVDVLDRSEQRLGIFFALTVKDIDLYTFQDQDNTQMHMYMHSTGFVNFFGNMQVTIMEQMGLLDTTDAAAVKAVFDSIDEAVETINVSFVMTRAK